VILVVRTHCAVLGWSVDHPDSYRGPLEAYVSNCLGSWHNASHPDHGKQQLSGVRLQVMLLLPTMPTDRSDL